MMIESRILTVGLLVAGTGAGTTELLRFAATGIGDEQCAVELNKDVLDFLLALFIDIFLVVGNQGFGEGLTDSINLRDASTTLDADPYVDIGETIFAQQENG